MKNHGSSSSNLHVKSIFSDSRHKKKTKNHIWNGMQHASTAPNENPRWHVIIRTIWSKNINSMHMKKYTHHTLHYITLRWVELCRMQQFLEFCHHHSLVQQFFVLSVFFFSPAKKTSPVLCDCVHLLVFLVLKSFHIEYKRRKDYTSS